MRGAAGGAAATTIFINDESAGVYSRGAGRGSVSAGEFATGYQQGHEGGRLLMDCGWTTRRARMGLLAAIHRHPSPSMEYPPTPLIKGGLSWVRAP